MPPGSPARAIFRWTPANPNLSRLAASVNDVGAIIVTSTTNI